MSHAADLIAALDAIAFTPRGVSGVGVDLVNVEAVEVLLASGQSAFLNMGWTDVEQQDAGGAPERLAARWAAKEAVMKSLKRGIGDVDPLDIEVTNRVDGAPVVRLCGNAARAAEQAGVETIHISMSHEEGWAVAFAVAAPRSSDRFSEDTSKNATKGKSL